MKNLEKSGQTKFVLKNIEKEREKQKESHQKTEGHGWVQALSHSKPERSTDRISLISVARQCQAARGKITQITQRIQEDH